MLSKRIFTALLAIGLFTPIAQAEEGQAVEPPPAPPSLKSGEVLEPDVTIRETEAETIREYRVGGQLVMVEVTPKNGMPPYYFFDQDGDAELEYSQVHPQDAPTVNQWVLFRWW